MGKGIGRMGNGKEDQPPRVVDVTVCKLIHVNLEKRMTNDHVAVMEAIGEVQKAQKETNDRLYHDNGKLSIQSKQNQHDQMLSNMAVTQKQLTTALSRLAWMLVSVALASMMAVMGLVLSHVFIK